jgi:serine/threonine-protein kinase
MAPERFRGAATDGAADVYSVGVMLYRMLAGRLPFSAPDADLMAIVMMHLHNAPPPLSEAAPGIAPEIDAIVMSTLRKDPRERPAIASLAASFARAAGRDNVAAPRRDAGRGSGVIPEGDAPTERTEASTETIRRQRPD